MKAWRIIGVVVLAVGTGCFLWLNWKHDEPRRLSLGALQNFQRALTSSNPDSLLDAVVLPAALKGRTPAEQTEFLTKALHDEISAEGLAVLKQNGKFGPVQQIFPQQAAAWCQQAGVEIDDCVAFKMDRGGIPAEVVLVREGQTYRVVRCNNVKQLAAAKL